MFPENVKEYAQKTPEKIAIVDRGGSRQTSYRDFDLLIDRIAAKLRKQNYAEGSVILLNMKRSMEYLAAYFAVVRAGCVLIPTTSAYPETRIRYIAEETSSPLIMTEAFLEDVENYEPIELPPLREDAAAAMFYTSGSTGNPKGVCHSLRSLRSSVERMKVLFEGIEPLTAASSAPFSFVICCLDCLVPISLGGTLHIMSEETVHDVRLVQRYYEDHAITCGVLNPGMLKFFGHTSALRRVFAGGQIVSNIYTEEHETYSVYGLTETFGGCCGFRIDRPYDATPIGQPFEGTEIEILGENGEILPENELGEITITGHLAEGYFKRPKETGEVFQRQADGRIRLSTRDMGYKNENGDIVYVSRKDFMVKINGQRVEPFEIEAVINKIDGIDAAVVKAFGEKDRPFLCAFYTASKETVIPEQIRGEIRKSLPEYMVPAYFKKLDEMPLTVTGKPDRNSLQLPKEEKQKTEYEAPIGEKESKICLAMEHILKCGRVGRKDDFMAMGGDSLSAMQLLLALEEPALSTADIIAHGTPEELARLTGGGARLDTEHDDIYRKKEYELTSYQQRYYNYWEKSPGVLLGNMPILFALPKGKYTAKELQSAVQQALRQHPAYGTVLRRTEDGRILQHSSPHRIKKPKASTIREAALQKTKTELVQPFDLLSGPLYRCEIFSTEEHEYIFLDAHHIISDKTSVDLVLDDVVRILSGEALKRDLYYTYLQYLSERKADAAELTGFYEEYEVHPRYDHEAEGISSERIFIDCGMSAAQFRERYGTSGASIGEFLIAVSLKTMAEFNGSPKAAVQTIFNGRNSVEKQNMAGLLIAGLPIALDVSAYEDIKALENAVREKNHAAMAVSDFSPGTVRNRPVRDDILTVNYIPYAGTERPSAEPGCSSAMVPYHSKAKTCAFYVIMDEMSPDHEAVIQFSYNTSVYERASAQRFIRLFMKQLNLTGYTEVKTQDGLRSVSLENAELIGSGFFSRVYRLNDEQIIKVFIRDTDLAQINLEREKAKYAFMTGAPAAITFDIVRAGEHYGLISENIKGSTLGTRLEKDPKHADRYIKKFIETMRRFNQTRVPPEYRARITDARGMLNEQAETLKADLTAEEMEGLTALLNRLPESDHLLHGDCHMDNILYDGKKAFVIDMETVAVGPAILELAGLYSAYIAFEEYVPQDCLRFHRLSSATAAGIFYDAFLTYYRGKTEEEKQEIFEELKRLAYFHMMVWAKLNAADDPAMFAHYRGRFRSLL